MQDLNDLYHGCVFRADRKNKMAALVYDWLRHFGLLLWNQWTEFNETWQEARSQRPIPSLCFSGRSKKKMAALASDWLRHFRLLWNRWTEFNETWQEARSQCPLPNCIFRADRKNKMAALVSDWLRHLRLLLWNSWTEFNETWQEARSKRPLPSLCYLGRLQKQDGRPGLWLAETFSTSSLKSLNGMQRKLTGSKLLTSSTKFVLFGPIWKQDGRPGLWLAEKFWTSLMKPLTELKKKLDRKQDLKVLYQICVFRADLKNKMASPASDWLRHFRLLLWNRWTEFNETWQEARSQRLLPSFCFWADRKNKMAAPASDWLRHLRLLRWNLWTEFDETWQEARSQRPFTKSVFFGPIGKNDGRHGPWFAVTFLTSPLKLLNRIQRNLTGSKISTSSTKLGFSVWWVNKNYRPGRSVKKVAHCTQVHDMWPFGPLVYVFI